MGKFTMEMHDCSHKYLDGTKTCIQLFFTQYGNKTSIAYVLTDETQEEVLKRESYYMDFLLTHIKENTKWVNA